MARKVVWTDPAVEDLDAAVEFIAKDSPAYAATFAQQVCDAGDSLAEFAERGRRLEFPELRQFRRLLVGSHLLIYTIDAERVTLHAVMHSSRDVRKGLRGGRPR